MTSPVSLSSPSRRPAKATPCVLLTGFDPFGGESTNPSWLAVAALHGRRIAGHRVVGVQLPTSFRRAERTLRQALREHAPQRVIAVGQAARRAEMSLERIAINLIDARIPDNDGHQPIDLPVIADGPDGYFATLPLKTIVQALHSQGIPASISYSAGTYVCNQVFYVLMHALRRKPQVLAGFVHVPYLPEQAARQSYAVPSMSLETIVAALRLIVTSALAAPLPSTDWSAGREA
jgi:pyroglutamyl-peptidase